jgi:hypothetical protein
MPLIAKEKPVYECTWCKKNYTREKAFMEHKCPVRARMEQLRSPLGQAAYMFYAKWMHASKRAIPEQATFMTSKFYESFIRFAKFNKALQLPSTELYVQVMMQKDIPPNLWTDDRAYSIYLEHMEYHIDPKLSIIMTSESLAKLCKEYECEISDVFARVNKNDVIQLIRERKLSPWILLRSPRFHEFLGDCSREQLAMIETLIDAPFWKKKFKADPKTTKFVGLCIQELGL